MEAQYSSGCNSKLKDNKLKPRQYLVTTATLFCVGLQENNPITLKYQDVQLDRPRDLCNSVKTTENHVTDYKLRIFQRALYGLWYYLPIQILGLQIIEWCHCDTFVSCDHVFWGPGVCRLLLALSIPDILRLSALVRQPVSLNSSDYLLICIRIWFPMLIRARNGTAYTEVEYEPTEGLEVLNSQLASQFSDVAHESDFLLVDYAG